MRPLTKAAALTAMLALVTSLIPVLPAAALPPAAPVGGVQLNAIQFLADGQHGWAVGGFQVSGKDYAFVERTSDGGTSWTRSTVGVNAKYFKSISFVSPLVGYAADGATGDTIFKTIDGGATWQPVSVSPELADMRTSFDSVWFADANDGFTAGAGAGVDTGVVWRTTDGGDTWSKDLETPIVLDAENHPINNAALHAVTGYDASHVLAVGDDIAGGKAMGFRKTGSTWTTDTVPGTNLKAASYADANHALAVGAAGKAAVFNGSSWTAVTGVTTDLDAVSMPDASHAWAVGANGVIRPWTGGSSFGAAQNSQVTSRLRGTWFTGASNGWAVGDNETMIRTTDGGAHWVPAGPLAAVTRMAGADRVATALKASVSAFPTSAPVVVLASGWNWQEALPAAAFAGNQHGPLLLVRPTSLDTSVGDEIVRLNPSKIYLVGTTTDVSDVVKNAVQARTGKTVERLAGGDFWGVGANIAGRLPKGGTVYVARSDIFADALAASSVAAHQSAPIILVPKTGIIPASSRSALIAAAPKTVVICGSTVAVDSGVEGQIKTALPGATVLRKTGTAPGVTGTRFDTARGLIDYGTTLFGEPDGIYLATGWNYPDALSGGVAAGASADGKWRPLMTTDSLTLSAQAAGYMDLHHTIKWARVLGSDYDPVTKAGAVDDAVLPLLRQHLY